MCPIFSAALNIYFNINGFSIAIAAAQLLQQMEICSLQECRTRKPTTDIPRSEERSSTTRLSGHLEVCPHGDTGRESIQHEAGCCVHV